MARLIQREKNGIVFFTSPAFEAEGGVCHAFTTRLGGVSEGPLSSLNLTRRAGDPNENIEENRRRLCAAVGLDPDKGCSTSQTHTDRVLEGTLPQPGARVFPPHPDSGEGVDALVSARPGLGLMVFTADCTPILLYDPRARAVSAVHSGWRGTAAGIVAAALREMAARYGSRPGDILAAIGPAIGPCCFDTHGDVPDAMKRMLGGEAEPYIRPHEGKWLVDIKGLNRLWLTRSGVSEDRIDQADECTACRPDLFWSHRKMGAQRGNQGAVIALV